MRFKSRGDYYGQTESSVGQERQMIKNPGKFGAAKNPLAPHGGADHGMEKAKAMSPKNVNSSEDRQNFEQARRFKKVKKLKNLARLKAIKK